MADVIDFQKRGTKTSKEAEAKPQEVIDQDQAIVKAYMQRELQKIVDSVTGDPQQSFSVLVMNGNNVTPYRYGMIRAGVYVNALNDELFEMNFLKYQAREALSQNSYTDYIPENDE